MPAKMTSKGKKTSLEARHKSLADACQRTLTELVNFLEKNHLTSAANDLNAAISGKSSADIMDELLNKDSVLCGKIPLALLSGTPKGRNYIDSLRVIQPSLVPVESPLDDVSTGLVKAEPAAAASSSAGQTPPQSFDPLNNLPEGINGQLGDLIKEILSSGDLCRLSGDGPPQPVDMMGMFNTVSTVLSKKAAEGSLDMEALDKQAQGVWSQLSEQSAELGNAGLTPDIASVMSNFGNTGIAPDISSIMSAFGALNQ